MKNKFKYFVLFPLMILIVILTLTYDVKDLISLGVRIPFGEAYWKDSLTNGIVTNKSIRMQPGDSLYYNGVTVTSGTGGGGIAASDNINFTGRDTAKQNFVFADSMTALRYSRVDSLFTKNITPDDNKGLSWANTSSVKSTSGALYYTGGSHSFNTPYNTNVVSLDSINGLNLAYGNFTPASGNGLLWDATHKITYTSPTMTMRGNYWTFKTAVNNSTLLQLDSVIGMQLYSGVYIGNGSGLTSVDAITLKGQDTTHFARTDTLITERVKAKTEFSDIVAFFLSPTVSAFYKDAARTIQYFLPNSASDTLLTRSQTQTITNKTIAGGSNTITGIKSGMTLISPVVLTPVPDASTYYFGGNNSLSPTSVEGQRRIYMPIACTIKAVIISTYIVGTPTNEAVSLYIRKNSTTDSVISTSGTWGTSTDYNVISKYNMGVVFAAGDYFEFKLVTPTWATNPTSAYINATFYFE